MRNIHVNSKARPRIGWHSAKQKNTLAQHVLDIISDPRCACVFLWNNLFNWDALCTHLWVYSWGNEYITRYMYVTPLFISFSDRGSSQNGDYVQRPNRINKMNHHQPPNSTHIENVHFLYLERSVMWSQHGQIGDKLQKPWHVYRIIPQRRTKYVHSTNISHEHLYNSQVLTKFLQRNVLQINPFIVPNFPGSHSKTSTFNQNVIYSHS